MNTRRMHAAQPPICAVITDIEIHCPDKTGQDWAEAADPKDSRPCKSSFIIGGGLV